MSSVRQKPPLSYARASRPTTHFATPACAADNSSPSKALVALDILVSSLRGAWVSGLSQSDVDPPRKGWRGLRSHDARQSTVPHGVGYKGGSRSKCTECEMTGEVITPYTAAIQSKGRRR